MLKETFFTGRSYYMAFIWLMVRGAKMDIDGDYVDTGNFNIQSVGGRKMKTVKEYMIEIIEDEGMDGLFTDDCGCFLCNLMPCGGSYIVDAIKNCKPGRKVLGTDGDWKIVEVIEPEEEEP